MIRFSCPSCAALLQVADGQAGARVLCSRCRKALLVPGRNAPPPLPTVALAASSRPPLPAPAPDQAGADVVYMLPLNGPTAAPARRGRALVSVGLFIAAGVLILGGIAGTVCCLRMETTVEVWERPPPQRVPPSRIMTYEEYADALQVAALNAEPEAEPPEPEAPPSVRTVNDEGLMDERRNGLLVSLAGVGFGIALLAVGLWSKSRL